MSSKQKFRLIKETTYEKTEYVIEKREWFWFLCIPLFPYWVAYFKIIDGDHLKWSFNDEESAREKIKELSFQNTREIIPI